MCFALRREFKYGTVANTVMFQSQVKSKGLSGLGSMFVYFSKI
jgi:hypothetical protein